MFGRIGKDSVTGFSGIIIGYVKYATGCNQVLIAPKISKDGALIESIWFDESRVEVKVGAKKIHFFESGIIENPGFDRAAPTK